MDDKKRFVQFREAQFIRTIASDIDEIIANYGENVLHSMAFETFMTSSRSGLKWIFPRLLKKRNKSIDCELMNLNKTKLCVWFDS